MISSVIGGAMLPHAPQFFTMPETGYLYAGHVVAVPDRLQERIGEAEIEDIHDSLFPEEVVDAKDRVLREYRPRHVIELAGGGQVAPERLFDNDARMLGQF